MWDPALYRQFAGERSRPFYELAARIGAVDPGFVADIGCGPGGLTAGLCRRWPGAEVVGVDSSAEMIAEARRLTPDEADGESAARLRFEHQDARDWKPGRPVGVIVSNALLQWIPDHEVLLTRWAGWLADDGWLAVQLPGNHDEPTHALLRELAGSPRWRQLLAGVSFNRQAADPAVYLDLLATAGCAVDAWETTYLHVLTGADAVLRWVSGTGLRPVFAALHGADRDEFMAEYGERLRAAYPSRSYGTLFPFRRVFIVARAGGGPAQGPALP
ncbi:MAG TPA: trans-aconitate 2-methyltransferase [Streptosporangiaceae bacterium]|nr:trans-aconitate 2-methyltransferase [Streptosporangiaceae bacterium]